MTYDELMQGKINEVLTHVVFKEHTLGYLFRSKNHLYLGILRPSKLKGSPWDNLTGSISILPHEFKDLKEATQEDFDDFNVSSRGHLFPVD